jgi:hypothetical protein
MPPQAKSSRFWSAPKARPFLEPIGSTIRHFGAVGFAVSRRNGAPS